jgi:hypothetical protein
MGHQNKLPLGGFDPEIYNEDGELKKKPVYLKRYTVYGHKRTLHLMAKHKGQLVDISVPAWMVLSLLTEMFR